jgi:hypothetical protein
MGLARRSLFVCLFVCLFVSGLVEPGERVGRYLSSLIHLYGAAVTQWGDFNLAALQLMSKVPISGSKQCLEVMCVVNTVGFAGARLSQYNTISIYEIAKVFFF